MQRTLFKKIWDEHVVSHIEGKTSLIYIDRVFLHERTGSVALKGAEYANRSLRNPEQIFCTMDHIVDTTIGRGDETMMPSGKEFITSTRESAKKSNITLFDIGDPRQGIVHVISAEQGITLPGFTQVCPDSHTCTLGALGALAWGIGSSEGEHAIVTKTLATIEPNTMRVEFNGELGFGVTSKDMILYLISQYTAAGGSGYIIEFSGSAIDCLSQEARFTLCNMAVEFGAFSSIIAPDDTTIQYVEGRPFSPKGRDWDAAMKYWRKLKTDSDAVFNKTLSIDCDEIIPQVSWGTSPGHSGPVTGNVPEPMDAPDLNSQRSWKNAIDYMGLIPGTAIEGVPINGAFIGSCTNSRISDLRAVAEVVKGRQVAKGVRAVVVPGSTQVKAEAEREGIDRVLQAAGFEWRESGCSMCFYAGGESFGTEERVISSTNRNFQNRQGPGTRTHLASPTSVAASAIKGCIADVRKL